MEKEILNKNDSIKFSHLNINTSITNKNNNYISKKTNSILRFLILLLIIFFFLIVLFLEIKLKLRILYNSFESKENINKKISNNYKVNKVKKVRNKIPIN